jgi:hypothetical protein
MDPEKLRTLQGHTAYDGTTKISKPGLTLKSCSLFIYSASNPVPVPLQGGAMSTLQSSVQNKVYQT